MITSLDPHLTRVVYAKKSSDGAEHVEHATDAAPPVGFVPVMLVTIDQVIRFSPYTLPPASFVAQVQEELLALRNSEVVDASPNVSHPDLWVEDVDDVKSTAREADTFGLTAEEVLAAYPRLLLRSLEEVTDGNVKLASGGQRSLARRLAKVSLRHLGSEELRGARKVLAPADLATLNDALQEVANVPAALPQSTRELLDTFATDAIKGLDARYARALLDDSDWLDSRSPNVQLGYGVRRDAQLKLIAQQAQA